MIYYVNPKAESDAQTWEGLDNNWITDEASLFKCMLNKLVKVWIQIKNLPIQ